MKDGKIDNNNNNNYINNTGAYWSVVYRCVIRNDERGIFTSWVVAVMSSIKLM